jgi:hypothetical protein
MRQCQHAYSTRKASYHADSRATLRRRVPPIYLAAPLYAQARTPLQTRLLSRLQPYLVGPIYRDAVEVLARTPRYPREAGHPLYRRLQSLPAP